MKLPFSKKNPSPVPEDNKEDFAPGTRIRYNPKLIPEFKADHQELLTLFTGMLSAAERADIGIIQKNISMFGTRLRSHLLKEMTLYIYLRKELEHDVVHREVVAGFHREMGQIGQAVNRYITKYQEADDTLWKNAAFLKQFITESKAIAGALVKRIGEEENTLYELYAPVGTYR